MPPPASPIPPLPDAPPEAPSPAAPNSAAPARGGEPLASDRRGGPVAHAFDRRGAVLKIAGVVLAGGLLTRFLTPLTTRRAARLRVPLAAIPRDGALVFAEDRVAIVDRAGVRYALSLTCTHLGCTADLRDAAITCHCHGSVFDLAGAVVRGPADRPLATLPVREDGDALEVLL